MSLDITSHPDRPGTDELVPSRYALRVGEIDVLVISDGVFPCHPRRWPPMPTRPSWRPGSRQLQPPDVYKWPLNVVVVRSGGRSVRGGSVSRAGVGAEFPDVRPGIGQLACAAADRGLAGDPWDERECEMYPAALTSPYHDRSRPGATRNRCAPVTDMRYPPARGPVVAGCSPTG